MKYKLPPSYLWTFGFLLACWLPSRAQVAIGSAGAARESFNAIASGTALPAHWKMSAAGLGANATWSGASNVTTLTQAAHSGSPATGGRYNWGTAEDTDRAVGFMSDGSYSSPNAILVRYQNKTGVAVSSFTISFQVERYRINASPFSVAFSTATNDVTYMARSEGAISSAVFASGASEYNFTTPQTVYKTLTITENIPVDGSIYLRWVFTSTGNASQGLGLDNVTLSLNTTTPAVSATLVDALTTDVNNNSKANEGDKLTYTTTISSTGKDATNVQYNAPLDANTTLSGAVKTSAIAIEDNFATPFNTPLTGANVSLNDFGLPAKTVVSFGTTEFAVVHLAGSAGTTDNGGTLTVGANGSFAYTPPAGFTGYDRFSYALQAGVAPNDVGVVTIAVGNAPSAGEAESFPNVIGNVRVNQAPSLLSNDTGDGLTIAAVNGNAFSGFPFVTTTAHGNLTIQSNGTFTYNPAAGYTGTDNFTYTIDNGFSSPVTVTVPITVAGMIWFIDNTAAAGGDGRLGSPFNSLAGVSNGAGGSGDNQTIFVYNGSGNYAGGIILRNGQKLIGQGASATLASLAGVTVPAYSDALPTTGGTAPVLTSATAVITLGSGNTVRGLSTSGGTSSVLGTTIAGATIQENTFNGATGEAISLTTHSGTSLISGNTVSATSYAVRVGTAASGTLNIALNNNTITSTSGNGALIDGTGGSLTTITGFSGNTVSGNTAFTGISITNARFDATPGGAYDVVSGGTTTIGASGNPLGAGGLELTGVTGDLSFSDLDIYATGSVGGLNATSSGTYNAASGTGFQIAVAAGASTIEVNGGPGVSITNASINLPLASYTSTNSPARGLSLVNTTGSFSTSTTGSITGSAPAGTAVFINGGNSNVSIGVPVRVTQGKGVDIASRNGGTVAFTGALSLTTGTNPAFSASSGGTVTVAGTTNTITSTTGTALNVSNTTIGAGGLNFRSISANGASTGLVLNNTGTSGGLSVTGDGITANSGGTIQNTVGQGGATPFYLTPGTGKGALEFSNTANFSLKFMKIFAPKGNGFQFFDIKGNNTIDKCLVDYNNTVIPNAFALRWESSGLSSDVTLTLDGTTFQNKGDGTTAVSLSAYGVATNSSKVLFKIKDSNTGDAFESKYTKLFGSGIVIGAGDAAGSTTSVSAEVSDTKFVTAWPIDGSGNPTTGGLNDLEFGVAANAILDLQVINNTFDDIGRPLAQVGVINVNSNDNGRLGSLSNPARIAGNVIQNIGIKNASFTGGYLGMRFALQSTTSITHRLVIANNQVLNVVNSAMLLSSRNNAIANVSIDNSTGVGNPGGLGNTFGTVASPVGQNNRPAINADASDFTTMNLLMQNNSLVAQGSGSANSVISLTSGIANNTQNPTATFNATVVNNTIRNTNASAGNSGRFRARTLAPVSPNINTSKFCIDLRNNVLEDASKIFELSHNSTGTFNRSASGNTGTVTTSGSIGSVASCTTPTF